MNQNLSVNNTNFHIKGFALGLILKWTKGNSEMKHISISFYKKSELYSAQVENLTKILPRSCQDP